MGDQKVHAVIRSSGFVCVPPVALQGAGQTPFAVKGPISLRNRGHHPAQIVPSQHDCGRFCRAAAGQPDRAHLRRDPIATTIAADFEVPM
jgi:hypothetical protein